MTIQYLCRMKTRTLRSPIHLLKGLLGRWIFQGLLTIIFITVCFLVSGQNGKMPSKPTLQKQDSLNIIALNIIQAKKDSIEEAKKTKPERKKIREEEIPGAVEEMPSFPEGDVNTYIGKHLQYPPAAIEKKIQGRVIVQFWVSKDGSIGDIEVVRGVSPELDNEVVRIVQSMPKWKPARQRNQPVGSNYTLPINFKLPTNYDTSYSTIANQKFNKTDSANIAELDRIQAKKDSIEEAKKPKIDSQKETNEIIDFVEEMPSFPQGDAIEYIRKHIIYPPVALEKNIQGRVIVQFTIDLDGSVIDVKVARGIYPALDKEAVRLVQSMPKWKPGLQRNKPIKIRYTLPVNFTLPKQMSN